MSEFPMVSIGDLAASRKGAIKIGPFGSQLKKEEMVAAGVKVYGQENVILDDFEVGSRRISPSKFELLKSCELQAFDVVLTMMGTIGKCSVFPRNAERGIMDSHLLRIQPDPNLATSEFLARTLMAETVVVPQISRLSHGSIMSGLSSKIVRRLEIPLPSLAEQARIVQILDTVDAAIKATDRVIAKLEQVKQGLLHDLLSGAVSSKRASRDSAASAEILHAVDDPEVRRGWTSCELAFVIDPQRPVVYGILMPGYGFAGGVPVVKVKDIREGRINEDHLLLTDPRIDNEYRRSRLREGDLLFSIRGSVGRTAFVPSSLEGANITQDTARIAVTGANAKFVAYYLQMPQVVSFIEVHTLGQAVRGMNLRDVRRIPLILPPRAEQDVIADILESRDAEVQAERRRSAKLHELRNGLTDDLLTGRVRVTVDGEDAT